MSESTITPDEIRAIGEARHGKHWQRPLAKEMGVRHETVNRWVCGRTRIHKAHVRILRDLK